MCDPPSEDPLQPLCAEVPNGEARMGGPTIVEEVDDAGYYIITETGRQYLDGEVDGQDL